MAGKHGRPRMRRRAWVAGEHDAENERGGGQGCVGESPLSASMRPRTSAGGPRMRRRERVAGEHEAEDERGRRKWKASAALGKVARDGEIQGEMRQEEDDVWGESFFFYISNGASGG